MLAAVYEASGRSAEVLQVREIETPEPSSGEVRVRIAVSGVNPTDWKTIRGAGPRAGAFAVPNQDGAGTIDAVGPGVDPDRIGQRVWLLMAARNRRWGTAAEYSVVPADRAVPLPDSASFELGASIGVPALTAWYCLMSDGPIAGRSVLIAGGAGAVGHAAIELARFEGAGHVVTTVSGPDKAKLARAAGPDTVINYRDADAAEQIKAAAGGGIDRIVEVALAANLELDLAVAGQHAVIITYADDVHTAATVPIRRLMSAGITLRFMLLYAVEPAKLRAAIRRVSAAVAAGALTTLPLHRYPLERIAEAHEAVERGAVGKVVLDLSQ